MYSGELRGSASLLHKKRRGRALEVRLDARERKGVKGEAGDNHGDRNKRKTAAVCRTPASNFAGLEAWERGKRLGNGRGDHGLLIAAKKEANNGH